jgi:predicted O-methyltransferase YrrM
MLSFDSDELRRYLDAHSTPEEPVLEELSRRTHLGTVYPQMMSDARQGQLLSFLSRMIRPTRILEIGTFTGYSAICMARGLAPGGRLITIEMNDEYEPVIREFFEKAGIAEQTDLMIGDALEILPHLEGSFDLVFLDANKRQYSAYYDQIIDKVSPGGIILTDNVLWDGKVLQNPATMDEETAAIHRFNQKITADPGVENFILPVRDGIMMIRKK